MSEFADRFWTSRDGLKLHYRDYAGRDDRPPVLCLHGLTRNARDAEGLAARLAGEWRVLCPEMRGRGDSAYARDSATYNPLQYVEDLGELFEQAGLERAVFVGTSLGGLMAMIMALTHPQRLAGVVLNDVGPEIDPAGLERIRGYVGQGRNFPTWMHAARALEESQKIAFPDNEISDWLVMAKKVMVVGGNGRIHFDYDMKIAEPFARPGGEAGVDMWPALAGLKHCPALLLRGELSDVLSPATHQRMAASLPDAQAVEVPRVGHAPTLDEPVAAAAIDQLLARIA
ncbi:alpha/beta fold hydrolase [Novosphingobium sp. B 225]|uniref:alpha/beta fold hydrolase n=1 Tax=Novosphingobium sp. B 225 TaxID=1961849 RepID=UPI000B4A5B8A|nr:alpha/beta hydrolase [Novosphingobium sp. B 225]